MASAGPGPESNTSNLARPSASLSKRTTTFGGGPPGRFGRLDGVEDQVDEDLPQRFGVAQHGQRFGGLEAESRFCVGGGRSDQGEHVAHQRLQLDPLRNQRRGTPQGEKPLQVGFHQAQLADGHFQGRLVLPAGTLPLVQFDGHPRPGGGIAELMGHAGAKLPERPQAFVAPDRLLVAAERLRHAVDRQGQVADLVVAARDGHGLELPWAIAAVCLPSSWMGRTKRRARSW